MRNTITVRKNLLEELGGLPEPRVENKEWLYILGEETRNSISIEGYFVSEKELEEVLLKNRAETRDERIAFNYFRTALFIYGLAYESYKTGELILNHALIRQINKGITERFSEYRKKDKVITGARLKPPSGIFVGDWMELYLDWTKENLDKEDIVRAISRQHILFESIHPFEDGNGRSGRIILNYLLISKGLPPIIIKGDEKDRRLYIKALEEGDKHLRGLLSKRPDKKALFKAMDNLHSHRLERLIERAMINNLDRILMPFLSEKKGLTLMPSYEVAKELGYSPDSIRELIRRGHFIAVKKGKAWLTHPTLDIRKMSL